MANNRINITITAKDDASGVVTGVADKAVKANQDIAESSKAAADRTRISASQMSSSFGSVADSIGGLLKSGVILASAGSFGMGAMAKASLDQVSAVQQATVALQAYEPNAAKVSNTLSELVAYAQSDMGVLFQRQDLFAAAQGLKIMGDNTDSLTKHVQIMSRSVGLGLSTFEGLGNVIQRVGSTGKLYADDLQFLQNAGFQLDSSLSGTTQTFESLFSLLDKGIPADAMAGQADTINGKMVRLQSAFRGLGNQMLDVDSKTSTFVKGGLGDSLMGGLNELITFLKTPEMKDGFASIGASVASFTKAAIPMIENVLSWVVHNMGTVVSGIGGLAAAFVAAKVAAMGFAIQAALVANPFILIAAGAALLVGGITFLQLKFDIFSRAVDAVRTAGQFLHDKFLVPVGDFLKDSFTGAVDLAKDSVKWLNDRVDDGSKAFATFKGWLDDNATAIKTVATILGVIFGPALIKAGTQAVVAGVKIAASGVAAGAGWVAGAVASSAAWVVNTVKMGLLSGALNVLMVKDSIVAGAAWAKNAVVASAAWVLNMAKTSAAVTATAVVSSLQAADAGWAWVINAGRASFAWVTTELPKIVGGFIVTSSASVVEAGKASAAWVVNAARTSFVWVVTELPKIVEGFLLTSGAAVVHAGFTSAAWIGSATASGVAWVVTELPRIIAAFIAMSGGAVVNAAIAAAAWVASATESSLAVEALKALVSTPLVMPAITVFAAIAAIATVLEAVNTVIGAIDAMNAAADAKKNLDKITSSQDAYFLDRAKNPIKYGAEASALAKKYLHNEGYPGYASGTNYAQGGDVIVGEHGVERVTLPQGSQVTPAYRTRTDSTTQERSGHTVIIQNMNINNGGDEHRLLSDIGFALETAS